MANFGGYKIFRPRLTKYCRGCVPGVPGGVDAPAHPAYLMQLQEPKLSLPNTRIMFKALQLECLPMSTLLNHQPSGH